MLGGNDLLGLSNKDHSPFSNNRLSFLGQISNDDEVLESPVVDKGPRKYSMRRAGPQNPNFPAPSQRQHKYRTNNDGSEEEEKSSVPASSNKMSGNRPFG